MDSLIMSEGGRRDGGYGCFAGDGGVSISPSSSQYGHWLLFLLIYISQRTRGITPPQPPFANMHAVVAMQEDWHGFFDYIQKRAAGFGSGYFIGDGGGGKGVVEDYHAVFACMRNAGGAADFAITGRHIKQ